MDLYKVENYENLLSTQTEDIFKGLVDIVHEKAIENIKLRHIYAKVCNRLSSMRYSCIDNECTYFGDILIEKCKKQLNMDFCQELNYDDLIDELSKCEDNKIEKSVLQETTDAKLLNAKTSFFQNILFLGDYFEYSFKWKSSLVINEELLHNCIEILFTNDSNDEYIECLCNLMTKIGQQIDTLNNANKMDIYFSKLNEILRRKNFIPLKTRFMILDLIKLRLKKWSKINKTKIEALEKKLYEIMMEHFNGNNEDILSRIKVYFNWV